MTQEATTHEHTTPGIGQICDLTADRTLAGLVAATDGGPGGPAAAEGPGGTATGRTSAWPTCEAAGGAAAGGRRGAVAAAAEEYR